MNDEQKMREVLGIVANIHQMRGLQQGALSSDFLHRLNLPAEDLGPLLQRLADDGLLRVGGRGRRPVYYLTQLGRDTLAQPAGGFSVSNIANSNIAIQQGSGHTANQSNTWVKQLEVMIDLVEDATPEQKGEAKSALRKVAGGAGSFTRDVAGAALGAIVAAIASRQI